MTMGSISDCMFQVAYKIIVIFVKTREYREHFNFIPCDSYICLIMGKVFIKSTLKISIIICVFISFFLPIYVEVKRVIQVNTRSGSKYFIVSSSFGQYLTFIRTKFKFFNKCICSVSSFLFCI